MAPRALEGLIFSLLCLLTTGWCGMVGINCPDECGFSINNAMTFLAEVPVALKGLLYS